MDTYNNKDKEQIDFFLSDPAPEAVFSEEEIPEYKEDTAASAVDVPAAEEIPVKKRKKKLGWLLRLVSAVLTVALVVFSCGVTALLVNEQWEEKLTLEKQVLGNRLNVLQQQLDNLKNNGNSDMSGAPQGPLTPGQVYAQNVDAVVAVICTLTGGQSFGSGFIISRDGYIVSNYHVVQGANSIVINTTDGMTYKAKLIGYDDIYDVSLLKIDGTDLPCVTIGSSDALSVGDQVAAIGNPLGDELASTLTVGYVSGKEREVNTDGTAINMIQTDAAINSGNSGGPLFNMRGEVIGITTAKYSGTSTTGATIEGIGFAVPVDDIKDSLADLKEFGYIRSAYLGVMVREMDKTTAEMYGLPLGVYVDSVTEGNCAQLAGIQAKDIITDLGGYEIQSLADLTRALRKLPVGEQTTVTVYRAGRQVSMFITLEEKPENVN